MSNRWINESGIGSDPGEFQKINGEKYIQRKDIQIQEIESNIFSWTSKSRIISKELYEQYMNELNSPAHTQFDTSLQSITENQDESKMDSLITMSAIAELYENQQESDKNMLTVMSAIADLYETITVLSGVTS